MTAMATLAQVLGVNATAVTVPATAGVPQAGVSALTDGEGLLAGVDSDALRMSQLASTAQTATAASNTNVVITLTAVAGKSHRLTFLAYDWSAAATSVQLTVEDGSGNTVLSFRTVTTATTVTAIPLPGSGIKGTPNTAMIITLTAGGSGVVGRLNIARITT
jgi:hypothetical protein